MEEERTLIRFYHSNKCTSCEQFLEGVPNGEKLKLCSMMEMVKNGILKEIDDKYMETVEDD